MNIKHANQTTRKHSTQGKRRVHFEVDANPGSTVAIAGSFNAWQPDKHVMKELGEGRYQRQVYLAPGDYEYKFVIDGEWSADPNCPHWTKNEFGTLNSIVHVEPKA